MEHPPPAPSEGARQVLVLNCGSSSVKYRLLAPDTGLVQASGLVERIGEGDQGRLVHRGPAGSATVTGVIADHDAALRAILGAFAEHGPDLGTAGLAAVGHRMVHGGEVFREPVVVDDEVEATVDRLSVLAPLHNPANLEGVRVARAALPDVPHVAVFDTAFHATIPPRAAHYAVPEEWRTRYGVRKYGFHGTSFSSLTRRTAALLGRRPEDLNAILLHLGNGASACAVAGGRSVDTTMGLTPLPGLVMGTRSGDVDPALPMHLQRVAGLSGAEVDRALNRSSGLLGLTGASDAREVIARAEAGEPQADAALDIYCYRIKTYVGAYYAALGRVDAVVFTAGVGENSPLIRARSLAGLGRLGIVVDRLRNESPDRDERFLSPDGAEVAVMVVPADEEREIASQALSLVVARAGTPRGGSPVPAAPGGSPEPTAPGGSPDRL